MNNIRVIGRVKYSVVSALFCSAATPVMAFELSTHESADSQPRIYGGEIAKTCEFPTTLGGTRKCTATLIHPRVLISANHCGELKEVFFGEYRTKPSFTRKTRWCERRPRSDAQICVLEEPIEVVPVAPIIQGCEIDRIKVGAKVLLAGYGLDENDPASGDDKYKDEKRWVETDIVKVNLDNLHIGSSAAGACNGDSGGPAFLQMDDGTWRTLGATYMGANGESHPNCDTGVWKRSDVLLSWFEEQLSKHNEKDIDLSPCFDDDGKWAPTQECGGYAKDVRGPYGSWDNNCGKGSPVVKYSATCGEPFKSEDDQQDEDEDPGDAKVVLTQPKAGSTFGEDEEIAVQAKVKSDKPPLKVELRVDAQTIGSRKSAPYRWELDDLEKGSHELQVTAIHGDGSRDESEVISITIEAASEDDSDPNEDDHDDEENGSSSKDNDNTMSKDSGPQSEEDEDPEQDSSSEDAAANESTPKRGCSMPSSPTGSLLWSLGIAGLFVGRRKIHR